MLPTSAVARTYVAAVAPAIGVQPLDGAAHRDHCNEKVIGSEPRQTPLVEDRVDPAVRFPEITGGTTFLGGPPDKLGGASAALASAAPDASIAVIRPAITARRVLKCALRNMRTPNRLGHPPP